MNLADKLELSRRDFFALAVGGITTLLEGCNLPIEKIMPTFDIGKEEKSHLNIARDEVLYPDSGTYESIFFIWQNQDGTVFGHGFEYGHFGTPETREYYLDCRGKKSQRVAVYSFQSEMLLILEDEYSPPKVFEGVEWPFEIHEYINTSCKYKA